MKRDKFIKNTLFTSFGILVHANVKKTPFFNVDNLVSKFSPDHLRSKINFNREWKFILGDPSGAQGMNFNDSKWANIGIPHSFDIPYFQSPKFYVGYGWYRKFFDIPPSWLGKRINIEFDGVFQDAELYINGKFIGEHKGGYTGFNFDITNVIKTGKNGVAVRVNNVWNPQLAPRAGEFIFPGGIYRNVYMVVTEPLHVGWYGTFVTTPQVSEKSGIVNVKTEVNNDSDTGKITTIKTQISDHDGRMITEMESTQKVPAGKTLVFDQTSQPIEHPILWSPENPYVYSVKTLVLDSGKPVDDYTSPLGFRWFKITDEKGFLLNGKHYYLYGANAHQDHAGWCAAVTNGGFYRDVTLIKEAGFNFIRGSHYPHAPAYASACDQLGILFWSENCFWGIGGFKEDGYWNASAYPVNIRDDAGFEASVKASLRDMIRINRNHPSIFTWSMGNEVFFSEKSVMPKVRRFLKELVDYSHELDPTRPAAIGGVQRPLGKERIDKIGDIAGYNGDGAIIPIFQNPGVPNLVSEYGSTISVRPGKYTPGWGYLSKYDGKPALPWRSGQALWCAFDHGSIAGEKFGSMGMVDYYRLPKRMWYWYRNNYRHIPPPPWPEHGIAAGLQLSADKTTLQSVDGTDDAQIIVRVTDKMGRPLCNSPKMKLEIVSGPGQFPTGPSITFSPDSDISIRDGEAAIEFRSYYSGKTVIRATSPGLVPATITITSLGEPKYIPGQTPLVKPRPYVRYTGGTKNIVSIFGIDNPTDASSEAFNHSSGLANDGNKKTFWQAKQNDENPYWQVDLEKFVTIKKVKVSFPYQSGWHYRIELSNNGENNWELINDQFLNAGNHINQTIDVQGNVRGRFLRIVFHGSKVKESAALSELVVLGMLNNR